MFSVTFRLFLLSLAPTLTIAEPCSVCAGFNEDAPIDINVIQKAFGDMMSMNGDNGNRRKRFLDEISFGGIGFMDLTTCGDLKTAALSAPEEEDECDAFDLLAYSQCGCTDDPPADYIAWCPHGGTFMEDATPDLSMMGDGELSGTCGEVAFLYNFITLVLSAVDLEDDNVGGGGSVSDDDMDTADAITMVSAVIQNGCGCNPDPDGCIICENGVGNPDKAISDSEGSTDSPGTCGAGYEMLQSLPSTMCAESKEQFKSAGCICKPAESTSAKKNIATLLVISAATTMVAFLW